MKQSYSTATFLLLCGLSTWFFYPGLFAGQSLVYGDNLHHSLAVLNFQSRVIQEGLSPLWTNLIYGGHPLFAEGQAGLANPFNYLVAWLFDPLLGQHIVHWASLIAIGMGCYGLCRCLEISRPGAMFGALASSFSGIVLITNSNMIVLEALIWVPWSIWSFEAWLKNPGFRQTTCFSLAVSMLILSGYPHFFHGSVLYMLISLISFPFEPRFKGKLIASLRAYVVKGMLAVGICAGIAAFQWMPLLELAGLSHRGDGTSNLWDLPGEIFIRGTMYYINIQHFSLSFPTLGSLLVAALASFILVYPCTNLRLIGHLAAVFLLVNLAVAHNSSLYLFIREYNLIPGISNFRAMFPYFHVAIFGACVFAAKTLDNLATPQIDRNGKSNTRGQILRLLVLASAWAYAGWKYHLPTVSSIQYFVAAAAIAGIVAMKALGRQKAIPGLLLAVLLIETIGLKLYHFSYVDNRVVQEKPRAVEIILSDPEQSQYKLLPISPVALSLARPVDEAMTEMAQYELRSIIASTNLLWGISSYTGAFALPTSQNLLVLEQFRRELDGKSEQKPGLRLLDLLSIKYVAAGKNYATRSLTPLLKPPENPGFLWENTSALPRFQAYYKARTSPDAESSLEILASVGTKTLVIESEDDIGAMPFEPDSYTSGTAEISLALDTATEYHVDTHSDSGFWLFLSDANYPGWKARINSEPAEVYTAQILGKAIRVPAGDNRVEIYFQSPSFRIGAIISIVTFLALLVLALLSVAMSRKTQTRRPLQYEESN